MSENVESNDATILEYENISQIPTHDSSQSNHFNTTGFLSQTNLRRQNEIQKLVINCVTDRIGNKWRDLARYLNVREEDIDSIGAKYHGDLKEQAYQALRISQSQCNSRRWKMELMRALEKVRRKDLSEWIEENYVEY